MNIRIAGILFWCLFCVVSIGAQEGRTAQATLSYGDVVQGEISDSRYEVFYDFAGRENEIVLLELLSTAEGSAFQWPEVTLFTNENGVLADSNEFVSINRSVIVAVLPYTGRYEILVSRDDGRTGEGVGPYELRVIQPQTLRTGETVDGNVRNNRQQDYYAVREPGFFSVYYEFSGGDLDPYIEAYRLVEDGELDNLASVSGDELVSASVGLNSGLGDVHIISVGDSIFAIYFNDRVETADYSLRLLTND